MDFRYSCHHSVLSTRQRKKQAAPTHLQYVYSRGGSVQNPIEGQAQHHVLLCEVCFLVNYFVTWAVLSYL